jgi:hypothetical protein
LSASAQVLFGAIANFVTGIADVPTDMVGDIVAAGRAIGHSREHLDIHHKWRHRKCKGANSNSQSDEPLDTDEGAHQGERAQNSRPNNQSDSDEPLPDEDSEDDEDEEMLSDSTESHSTDLVPDQSKDRRRSLQLEKSQTMSSEFVPSKPRTVFSEATNLGGRMSKKLVNLLIWLPTDLTLSLSKGFHNAPKLYHDPMVKSTPKVHDVRSGFRAAGKVFAFSLFPSSKDLELVLTLCLFFDRNFMKVFTMV